MKKSNLLKIGLAAFAVMLVGVMALSNVEGQVFADDGDMPVDTETPGNGNMGADRGPADRGRGGMRFGSDVYLASIAEQTGIAVEDLQAALDDHVRLEDVLIEAGFTTEEVDEIMLNAQYAQIDQAVADGRMTEENAAEVKANLAERAEQHQLWETNDEIIHDVWVAAVAENSGLNVAEIEAALDAGSTMSQFLQENFTAEEAQTILQTSWTQAIDQALADGLITDEQAALMADHVPFAGGPRGRMADGVEDRFGGNGRDNRSPRMGSDGDCIVDSDD